MIFLKNLVVVNIFLSLLYLLPYGVSPIFAEEFNISVRGAIGYPMILSGRSGSGSAAPEYSDSFNPLFISSGELNLRSEKSSAAFHIGFDIEKYEGKRYKDIKFEDLEYLNIYTGFKYYLFEKKSSNFVFYNRFDIGITFNNDLDINYQGVELSYWKRSKKLFLRGGFGTKWSLSEKLSCFLEVNFQYKTATSESIRAADSTPYLTAPIISGIEYKF